MNKIAAIKIIREVTGVMLDTAKNTADRLQAEGMVFDDAAVATLRKVTTLDLEEYYHARFEGEMLSRKFESLERSANRVYEERSRAFEKERGISKRIIGG